MHQGHGSYLMSNLGCCALLDAISTKRCRLQAVCPHRDIIYRILIVQKLMLTICSELSGVKSFPGRENILSRCPLKIWRWSLTSLSSRKVQMPWWEKDAHLDPITKSVLQLPNAKHFQNLAATEKLESMHSASL